MIGFSPVTGFCIRLNKASHSCFSLLLGRTVANLPGYHIPPLYADLKDVLEMNLEELGSEKVNVA